MADFLQMVLHTDIPALIARPALMQPEYAAEASLSLSLLCCDFPLAPELVFVESLW